jgi:hypothetical protein
VNHVIVLLTAHHTVSRGNTGQGNKGAEISEDSERGGEKGT